MTGLLIGIWITGAVLAVANYAYYRHPLTGMANNVLIGACVSGIAVCVLFILISIVRYDMALYGLILALAIALAAYGVFWAIVTGWRPTLPKLHVRTPMRMMWPQARYQRRYASPVDVWEIEEVDG